MGQIRTNNFSGEVEWYTPRQYLDAAIKVMGDIDLDPASSKYAQRHVQAKEYFWLPAKDGLAQKWFGRVWLNPPYSMPHIKRFVLKMVHSYGIGDIDEGILLTNSATDTDWCHQALNACDAVCFTKGRIQFLQAYHGQYVQKPAPMLGQIFFYFGVRRDSFQEVFRDFGKVYLSPP